MYIICDWIQLASYSHKVASSPGSPIFFNAHERERSGSPGTRLVHVASQSFLFYAYREDPHSTHTMYM